MTKEELIEELTNGTFKLFIYCPHREQGGLIVLSKSYQNGDEWMVENNQGVKHTIPPNNLKYAYKDRAGGIHIETEDGEMRYIFWNFKNPNDNSKNSILA